jgi:Uma2 family endonuclease
MIRSLSAKPKFSSLGDVVRHLHVSADRIRLDPRPGTATERDVIRIHDRENRLFELVDGVLVEKIMGAKEGYLGLEVGRLIVNFLDTNDLGIAFGSDATLRIMPHLVRMPDVSFISWEKLPDHTVPEKPIPELIPDLAVEVLSKGNTRAEMARKQEEYFQCGVRLIWVIEPDKRQARVFHSLDDVEIIPESGSIDGGSVLPGFRLPLRQLFKRLSRPRRPGRRQNGAK